MIRNAARQPARLQRPLGPVVDELEGRTLLTPFVSGVEHRTTQLDITVVNPAPTPVPTNGYTATIDWGDGQTSVGTVVSSTLLVNNRILEVTGQHVYAHPGSFSVHGSIKLNGNPLTSVDSVASINVEPPDDFDFVGSSEATVFRPSTGQWFIRNPNGSQRVVSFGAQHLFDIPVPGDYDGTGVTELAVFRPSTAQWFILSPDGSSQRVVNFGAQHLFDLPAPGDYFHDGITRPAVFRPSTGQWISIDNRGFAYGAQNLFDLPVETSIASLVALGKVKRHR